MNGLIDVIKDLLKGGGKAKKETKPRRRPTTKKAAPKATPPKLTPLEMTRADKTNLFNAVISGKAKRVTAPDGTEGFEIDVRDLPNGLNDVRELLEGARMGRPHGNGIDFSDPFNTKGWAKSRQREAKKQKKKLPKKPQAEFMIIGLNDEEVNRAIEAGKLAPKKE